MTGITLLQSCSVPKKMCVMHNILGVFCPTFLPQRFINPYNISKPTAKGAADRKQVSDWILHCRSHTRGIISQDSGARSPRHLPPPSLDCTPPLTRPMYFSSTPRPPAPFASGSQECGSIPEGSSCLHRDFSRRPLALLGFFTRLSAATAAAPAPLPLAENREWAVPPSGLWAKKTPKNKKTHPQPAAARQEGSCYKLKSPLS